MWLGRKKEIYVVCRDCFCEIGDEHVEAFMAAVIRQADNALEREKDCRRFDICVDPANPQRVLLYEIYTNKSAFDAHLQTDHFRPFDQQVKLWLISKKVMAWKLQEKGGKR